MHKARCLVVFATLVLQTCRHSPQIITHDTFFGAHHINMPPANALDGLAAQSTLDVEGVFWPHFYAVEKQPALLWINSQDRAQFVLLADSLAVPFGDYVRLSGVVTNATMPLSHTYKQRVNVLRSETVEILRDTHTFLSKAQQDYDQSRAMLKIKVAAAGSKLAWPEKPAWQLLVDKKRSTMIVYFSTADLMYAADVNFIYDLQSGTLARVYAGEWFKGE